MAEYIPDFSNNTKESLHIACEQMELAFTKYELKTFRQMWKEGHSLYAISKELNDRDIDELAILVIDQANRGRIEKRKNGYLGGE